MVGKQQDKPVFLNAELAKEIADVKKALEANATDLQKLTEEVDKVKIATQPK